MKSEAMFPENPEEKTERIFLRSFAGTLKTNDLLGECGFESNLKFDVAEIVSNLDRTLSGVVVKKDNLEETETEIETAVDAAISGEKDSLTPIELSEGEKQIIKDLIMRKIEEFVKS